MTKAAERMLRLMDHATSYWHIPVIGRRKGRLIRRLLRRYRPQRAVEIGSLLGYSAILIAGHLPPRGRLTCVEANGFLARLVAANVAEAGLGPRVTVIDGDARRVIPRLRSRFDFALIDAAKENYLDYLRRLEPKLAPGAVVVADNTKRFAFDVRAYLAHVRRSGQYESREYDFGADAMEVSIAHGGARIGAGRRRPGGAGAGPDSAGRGPAGTKRPPRRFPRQVRRVGASDR